MKKVINHTVVEVLQGDITKTQAEVIVNAANTSLLGGGGVDGAIHRAGGPEILNECVQIRNKQGGCAVGQAVITTAGRLPARHVIHTVGPVWNGGTKDEDRQLRSCYRRSLELASENNVRSIAFPTISTGIYKFPKARAAQLAVQEVGSYIRNESSPPDSIIFVCYDDESYRLYVEALEGV